MAKFISDSSTAGVQPVSPAHVAAYFCVPTYAPEE